MREQWQTALNTMLNSGLRTMKEIEVTALGFIEFSWQVEDVAVLPTL
jgi:hypothetical protein